MKKKSSKGLIITIVILALLLVGVSGYVVYDKFFSKEEVEKGETKTEQMEKNDINNNATEEISLVELENYSNIYNIVNEAIINNEMVMHTPLNNQPDYFYKQDKLYVSNMRYDVLMSMAISRDNNLFNYVDGMRTYYISNTDLKQSFTKIFGNDLKYYSNDFSSLSCEYKFEKETDRYEVKCGDIGNVVASKRENKVVKAIKTKDSIEVYDAVAFISLAEGKVCKDVEFKNCIATLSETEEFNIDNYIAKLNQYKYIFKLSSDGNYYFYGVELVK